MSEEGDHRIPVGKPADSGGFGKGGDEAEGGVAVLHRLGGDHQGHHAQQQEGRDPLGPRQGRLLLLLALGCIGLGGGSERHADGLLGAAIGPDIGATPRRRKGSAEPRQG